LALKIATPLRSTIVPLEIRRLIREVSIANPLWGAPRIHGELKLGIDVGQTSVAKYMARRRALPRRDGRRFFATMRMALSRGTFSWCRQSRSGYSMILPARSTIVGAAAATAGTRGDLVARCLYDPVSHSIR
jgi:hypothetical protein